MHADQVTEAGPVDVVIFSFGFKHGAAPEANLLVDVRFLPNPYWVEHLRPRSGRDPEVADHVLGSAQGSGFLERLAPLVGYLAAQARQSGRGLLRIGIGCTGGRHRSVAVAEALARRLEAEPGCEVQILHRDIDRNGG